MGNSKNKKVPKKSKASKKTKSNSSSCQKENDDGIAMSRQLLSKKNNARLQRKSSYKPDRVCPNGKLIPCLSELERMYADSDDDDNDQTPKTPTPKPTCTTPIPTPEKLTSISTNNLLSPTTINKITERLLGSIKQQNLPDPREVLEATIILREKSPPPAPIIPPKKRKKPDQPYIVGCKERPKVIRKPNTNFCKGDDDYGVEASGEDPEDETPTKRAKRSRIPKYSKSIFNAHSDEIAERLANGDAEGLSDASTDSNKTIKYDPTIFQTPRPHSFSPLPSTSTDSETIKKNDELFNDSLTDIKSDVRVTDVSIPEEKEDGILITEQITGIKKEDSMFINKQLTAIKEEDDVLISEQLTPLNTEDGIVITKQPPPIEKEDDVHIIDIPCDTIVIEEICDSTDTDVIEIIESGELESTQKTLRTNNDDDCVIVPNPDEIKTHNTCKLDEPIVIDDEYSSIDMDFESFVNETSEIIDVDDIIAENKSIFDRWNDFGSGNWRKTDANKITTIVDVPTTYRNLTTVTEPTLLIPETTAEYRNTSSPTLQAGVMPSSSTQPDVTALQTTSRPNSDDNLNMFNRDSTTNSMNNQIQQTSVNNSQRSVTFQSILDDFFEHRRSNSVSNSHTSDQGNGIERFFRSMINSIQAPRPTSNDSRVPSQLVNTNSVSTNAYTNINNRQRDPVEPSSLSSRFVTQQTIISPPSPVPSRNIGDCPICLDPLNSSHGIASTICGHVFCLKCIQASVKTNGKKCPTCRKALKGAGGGYHQLYL